MKNYDVAAYVWPSYTGDEIRTRIFWPDGIGEWQSVKSAVSKFPGHSWPRNPVWGYVNEADSEVMEMQIEQASKYGVNVFIYDWYWYDKRPFLENCLNDGFLKARNNNLMKFYIMWANHDAGHLWDKRNSHTDCTIWSGEVDLDEFRKIGDRLIEKYFLSPLYYRIDGKPVLSIYDTDNLIKGLGGIEETKRAFSWLRNRAVQRGLPGVHLQFVIREHKGIESILELGYDSMTHYNFTCFTDFDRAYPDILVDVRKEWEIIDEKYNLRFFPTVALGWDNNPRYIDFNPGITTDTTPENIGKGLLMARDFADNHDGPPLVIINSWNEWTETSYLQPDDINGYGYLEQVKKVFG